MPTWIATGQAIHAFDDALGRLRVPKTIEPLGKGFGLAIMYVNDNDPQTRATAPGRLAVGKFMAVAPQV